MLVGISHIERKCKKRLFWNTILIKIKVYFPFPWKMLSSSQNSILLLCSIVTNSSHYTAVVTNCFVRRWAVFEVAGSASLRANVQGRMWTVGWTPVRTARTLSCMPVARPNTLLTLSSRPATPTQIKHCDKET